MPSSGSTSTSEPSSTAHPSRTGSRTRPASGEPSPCPSRTAAAVVVPSARPGSRDRHLPDLASTAETSTVGRQGPPTSPSPSASSATASSTSP
ncbi:hypothetical protein [Nonomuraea dietziae]